MQIKEVSEKDLNKVVEVHKESFNGFFLTELGDNFLSLYYNSVRKNKNGILLGLYEEEALYGFAAATTLSKGFNKDLVKKNLIPFCFTAFQLLFTRIPALLRLTKNFSKTASIEDKGEYSELLSIGVSNEKQGKGIGKKLLVQLENELKLRGCSQLSLTTDYYKNEKAIGFYKSLGYEIYYDFVAYPNRRMYRMIKKI